MRIVSHEEERIYMGHADALLRDVSTIIVETGMRPGEIFEVHGENVNLDKRYISIPTGKTDDFVNFTGLREPTTPPAESSK